MNSPRYRIVAIVLAIASSICATSAYACGVRTPEQTAKWEARKDAARHFRGSYHENSRTTVIRKSDDPTNGDLEITTVNGSLLDKSGRVRASVTYVETNEFLLCLSGRHPADGQAGVVYAERDRNGRFYIIDFEETRKR